MMVVKAYHKIWENCRCLQLADEIWERGSVDSIIKTEYEDYKEPHLVIMMPRTDLGVLDMIIDYGMKYSMREEEEDNVA